MAPRPTDVHQFANNRLQTYLTMHVEFAGMGRVIGPPFDLIFGPGDTVQPDVMVMLQEHLDRITRKGISGAPDLVVEIASPSTATFDRGDKLHAYERAGVPEYWIADPYAHTVEVLALTGGSTGRKGCSRDELYCRRPLLPSFRCRSKNSSGEKEECRCTSRA